MNESVLESLFSELKECPEDKRKARIEAIHKSDPNLSRELCSLLEVAEHAQGFLSHSPFSIRKSADEGLSLPITLGHYKLVRELGSGGMGVVYEAIRCDGNFKKTVAVKVLRQHLNCELQHQRFITERQILADLEHPNIARLIDGGETDKGLPYLVMEYVNGQNIKDYCQSQTLTVNGILRLFSMVCEAVNYAHQNHIVHRDLKPSNILVDQNGHPKLLDFGIAKLLSNDSYNTSHTNSDGLLMTPEYAAPEQLKGLPVGRASDVYALGVVLYELLTGRLPYDISKRNILGKIHYIANCDIKPPSKRVSRNLASQLRGQIDNLVCKAVNKNQHFRYQQAGEFANAIHTILKNKTGIRKSIFESLVGSRRYFIAGAIIFSALMLNVDSVRVKDKLDYVESGEKLLTYTANFQPTVQSQLELKPPGSKTATRRTKAKSQSELRKAKHAKTLMAYQKHLRELEKQFAAQPTTMRLQLQTAKSEFYYSVMQAETNDINEAIKAAQQCIDTMDKTMRNKRMWWKNRFHCAMAKAHWYNVSGQAQLANIVVEQSLDMVNKAGVEYWVPIYRACEESSQILHLHGKYKEALAKQLECVKMVDNGASFKQPKQKQLAYIYHTLGDRYAQLGKRDDAIAAYEKSAKLWRAEMENSPDEANPKINLSDVLGRIGENMLLAKESEGLLDASQQKQVCEILQEANNLAKKATVMDQLLIIRQFNVPNLQQINNKLNADCKSKN